MECLCLISGKFFHIKVIKFCHLRSSPWAWFSWLFFEHRRACLIADLHVVPASQPQEQHTHVHAHLPCGIRTLQHQPLSPSHPGLASGTPSTSIHAPGTSCSQARLWSQNSACPEALCCARELRSEGLLVQASGCGWGPAAEGAMRRRQPDCSKVWPGTFQPGSRTRRSVHTARAAGGGPLE